MPEEIITTVQLYMINRFRHNSTVSLHPARKRAINRLFIYSFIGVPMRSLLFSLPYGQVYVRDHTSWTHFKQKHGDR